MGLTHQIVRSIISLLVGLAFLLSILFREQLHDHWDKALESDPAQESALAALLETPEDAAQSLWHFQFTSSKCRRRLQSTI